MFRRDIALGWVEVCWDPLMMSVMDRPKKNSHSNVPHSSNLGLQLLCPVYLVLQDSEQVPGCPSCPHHGAALRMSGLADFTPWSGAHHLLFYVLCTLLCLIAKHMARIQFFFFSRKLETVSKPGGCVCHSQLFFFLSFF